MRPCWYYYIVHFSYVRTTRNLTLQAARQFLQHSLATLLLAFAP